MISLIQFGYYQKFRIRNIYYIPFPETFFFYEQQYAVIGIQPFEMKMIFGTAAAASANSSSILVVFKNQISHDHFVQSIIDNWHTTKPGQLTMQMILFFESNLPADHPIMSRRSALHRDAARLPLLLGVERDDRKVSYAEVQQFVYSKFFLRG